MPVSRRASRPACINAGVGQLPARPGDRLADGLSGDAWLGVAGLGLAELADHTASASRLA